MSFFDSACPSRTPDSTRPLELVARPVYLISVNCPAAQANSTATILDISFFLSLPHSIRRQALWLYPQNTSRIRRPPTTLTTDQQATIASRLVFRWTLFFSIALSPHRMYHTLVYCVSSTRIVKLHQATTLVCLGLFFIRAPKTRSVRYHSHITMLITIVI